MSAIDTLIAMLKERGQPTWLHEKYRYYARQAFGEKEETESLHGQVKWFSEKDGYGFITLDTRGEAFFALDDIMTREAFRPDHAEGLSVHCRVIQGPHGPAAFDVRIP